MQIVYNIAVALGVIIAVAFSFLVFATGKGDAMSGGGGVRTSYKGKANFDDFVSRLTLILGISFMAVMLIIDVLARSVAK